MKIYQITCIALLVLSLIQFRIINDLRGEVNAASTVTSSIDVDFDPIYKINISKTKDLSEAWSHTSSNGESFYLRTSELDGQVGENLYKGPCDIREAVDSWNDSNGHREILDIDFDKLVITGIQKNGVCYIT